MALSRSREKAMTREIRHSACPHDCPDTCSMLVTVEDGRATLVRGNPDHPFTRGTLCVKVNNYPARPARPADPVPLVRSKVRGPQARNAPSRKRPSGLVRAFRGGGFRRLSAAPLTDSPVRR